MGNIPVDKKDFSKPLTYDGKYLRPFFWWSSHVLPTVYENSLSYYEVLDKIMFKLIEAFKDVNALGDDVTALHEAYIELQDEYWKFKDALIKDNDEFKDNINKAWALFQTTILNELDKWKEDTLNDLEAYKAALTTAWDTFRNSVLSDWANYQATINKEWSDYQSAMNKWKDDTDKKFAAEYQALLDFQTDMNQQWETYKSNLNNEWSEYKTDLTGQWNTEKESLENWKTQSDADIKAKLQEMTTLKSTLEQWKTDTDTAFNEYKTNLTAEWNSYKSNLTQEWTTYQTTLSEEWDDYQKQTTSSLNVLPPWLAPETHADFSDPTKLTLTRTGGFDSPAIFMVGNTGNVNITLNKLYDRLNPMPNVEATKESTNTLHITLDSGYILCYDTTPTQGGHEVEHFVVKTAKELSDTSDAHLIPLYGQGSQAPFCGVWYAKYKVLDLAIDVQANTQRVTELTKWTGNRQITIEWLFERYEWNPARNELTLFFPTTPTSDNPVIAYLYERCATYRNETGMSTNLSIKGTDLFNGTGHLQDETQSVTYSIGSANARTAYYNYEAKSITYNSTIDTSPVIFRLNPSSTEDPFFWGLTYIPDTDAIETDLNEFDQRITANTAAIANKNYTVEVNPYITKRIDNNKYKVSDNNNLELGMIIIRGQPTSVNGYVNICLSDISDAGIQGLNISLQEGVLSIDYAPNAPTYLCYQISTQKKCVAIPPANYTPDYIPYYFANNPTAFSGFISDIERFNTDGGGSSFDPSELEQQIYEIGTQATQAQQAAEDAASEAERALSTANTASQTATQANTAAQETQKTASQLLNRYPVLLTPYILQRLSPTTYSVTNDLNATETIFYVGGPKLASRNISAQDIDTLPTITCTVKDNILTIDRAQEAGHEYLVYKQSTQRVALVSMSSLTADDIPLYSFSDTKKWNGFLTSMERFNESNSPSKLRTQPHYMIFQNTAVTININENNTGLTFTNVANGNLNDVWWLEIFNSSSAPEYLPFNIQNENWSKYLKQTSELGQSTVTTDLVEGATSFYICFDWHSLLPVISPRSETEGITSNYTPLYYVQVSSNKIRRLLKLSSTTFDTAYQNS